MLQNEIKSGFRPIVAVMLVLAIVLILSAGVNAQSLRAGTGVVDITCHNPTEKISDPLLVKALVFDSGNIKAAIITIDAIAIGGIGDLSDNFLSRVRSKIEENLEISGKNILVNASHNHRTGGQVCEDVVDKTVLAVKLASENMTAVRIGAGTGYEDRVMMNRRLQLKNGKEWTIRHANPCPPDDEVVGVGPIDPEIGILRIDKADGTPLAVLYNFTIHPYTGIAGGGVTAELPGFASRVIQDNLGSDAVAFFLQGAAGDITEILYKDVNSPRTPEPFGNMLGLSTLKALGKIKTEENASLNVITENLDLPLRTDIPDRIRLLESEQSQLVSSLRSTSLNFKTFLPLFIKYSLDPEYPSYYSYRYLQEEKLGVESLKGMDAENRNNLKKYLNNISAMEKCARIQENLNMLRTRQAEIDAELSKTKRVEVQVMKIGDFVLVTFPGELFVKIGMNIKETSPFENTFIAGYSNGYFHYGPTSEAYDGLAYEDTNCLFAPEWESIYVEKVKEMLAGL